MENSTKIILGSASPRRKELLKMLEIDFQVINPDINEKFGNEIKLRNVPAYLSRKKVEAILENNRHHNKIIISADTIVLLDGEILEKPKDKNEAEVVLSKLSGKTHEVITSVCLWDTKKLHFIEDSAFVKFKILSQAEINKYIESGGGMDKAGGYGIQDWMGLIGIERIEGSFYTIMGLPTHKLYELLLKLKILKY
jgi:septum formation protein